MSPTALGVLLVVVSTMVEGFGQTFLKKSALDVARGTTGSCSASRC
jgi:hypothetical protein